MAAWLSKVMNALGGQLGSAQSVRRALQTAQRERAKLALEIASSDQTVVMATTIEQVRNDDFVISQPTIGGLTHPLAFGETLCIDFVCNSLSHRGASRCLGRVQIPAGGIAGRHERSSADGEQRLFGYRLALPESLQVEDRRNQPRVAIGMSQPIPAHLYTPASPSSPVLGQLMEISMTGALIQSMLPAEHVLPGQAMYLKAVLPEPVGLLDELVDIARVDIESRRPMLAIGVTFRRRVAGLDTLIRMTLRRAA